MESATCCGMESDQRSEWNHGNAVYGIKPQELYSIRASRNAMRDFVAIPYNTRGALIPYQACGLDNKKGTFGRQKFLFCWCGRRELNPYGKTTRPSNVRVCQFRHSREALYIIAEQNAFVKGFYKKRRKSLTILF